MSGSFLLDTNIVIVYFHNDSSVLAHVAQADEIFIASVALGELYYGAFRSAGPDDNLQRINRIATTNPVPACDAATAREYGLIKQALLAEGRPIPENDIWIAAIARQHGLTVATRDADFLNVDGLLVEQW